MNLTVTNPVHVIGPQDEAMGEFRKLFRLRCDYVAKDGMTMTYMLQTLPSAARWLSEAQSVITVNKLSLVAKVRAEKKGEKLVSVQLRIIYTPKATEILTEAPMPVGYAEHQPAINLAGIDPHLQHAFAGIIY